MNDPTTLGSLPTPIPGHQWLERLVWRRSGPRCVFLFINHVLLILDVVSRYKKCFRESWWRQQRKRGLGRLMDGNNDEKGPERCQTSFGPLVSFLNILIRVLLIINVVSRDSTYNRQFRGLWRQQWRKRGLGRLMERDTNKKGFKRRQTRRLGTGWILFLFI